MQPKTKLIKKTLGIFTLMVKSKWTDSTNGYSIEIFSILKYFVDDERFADAEED